MEAGKMERAAKSEDTRVGNLNIGGGILQVGEKSYMLNPLAFDFYTCCMANAPITKYCFSFTPTLTYTNVDMTEGIEYKSKSPCCAQPRYEVHKLRDFKPGQGFQKKELLAYTFVPSVKSPCWWRGCGNIMGCTLCPGAHICCAGPGLCIVGNVFGLCLWCKGPDATYSVLCVNNSVEYGVKDEKSKSPIYTFQNDMTGFEKVCCGGLKPPGENKRANCNAFKRLDVFRTVTRTVHDGENLASKKRNELVKFSKTAPMCPSFKPYCCCAFCCAESKNSIGFMRIDKIPGNPKSEELAEDDLIKLSLMFYGVQSEWPLLDCCLDPDPADRASKTTIVQSSGKNAKLHSAVEYKKFEQALAEGLIDSGSLLPELKAKFSKVKANL